MSSSDLVYIHSITQSIISQVANIGPANYNYAYAVADSYSGANFGATEARDGYATTGSYNVLLPDGRTQTVTYTVGDDYSGYVADVQYSGEPAPYAAAPAPHA